MAEVTKFVVGIAIETDEYKDTAVMCPEENETWEQFAERVKQEIIKMIEEDS